MTPLYEIRSVSYRYKLDGQHIQALSGISLNVCQGEFLALAGPSGSGKTTLLNVLGLLDRPGEGVVLFEGENVSRLSERERTLLRRERIGFIFQNFNLIPTLTAHENVEYFLLKRKTGRLEARARVLRALEAVGIAAQANQWPNSMSGGQRQRVAIARALVRQPQVVLADEPTASLDQSTGLAVIELMKRLNREQGMTCIFSTHDPKIIAAADRVVHLTDGRVIE